MATSTAPPLQHTLRLDYALDKGALLRRDEERDHTSMLCVVSMGYLFDMPSGKKTEKKLT